jgi:hypothetical protein
LFNPRRLTFDVRTHRSLSSPLVSLPKSGEDSIFFAHVSSSSTSFFSRRRSAALFSRKLRFSRTSADNPPRSEAVSRSCGEGDRKFTAFSGLSCNAFAVHCFDRFSCRMLGLLLNNPLGRSGAFTRPSCVGVGGRSGSKVSSSMEVGSGPKSMSSSPVALPNSNANCPSGVFNWGAFGCGSGDPNTRSPGRILLEILRGGFENAWMPLGRLLGEPSGASEPRGRVRGLAEALSEGRSALRSRSPIFRRSCFSLFFPTGRREGDLLSARSNTSGFDRARLALVGDWKDGRLDRCASFCGSSGATEMPVVSLVFRLFAGESIVAWGVRRIWRADDEDKQSCLQCLHYDLISLVMDRRSFQGSSEVDLL